MGRRIEIIAFEHERIVRRVAPGRCPRCGHDGELLSASQAAAMAEVELRAIHQWLAEGAIHGVTMPGGDQRVCKRSLLKDF